MTDTGQTARPAIGWIGVGLMGHGAARNIVEKGWPLSILGNRDRRPIDDLVARGAREAANPADLARHCDIVFLCVPSSTEVEALVFGPAGLLSGARPGLTVVDCTTADPQSTERVAAALAERGVAFCDSPLGRSPKEAEAGRLNTFTAGPADVKARIRPVQDAFCDTVIDAGETVGNGHRLKLVNNFVTCGTAALLSEALATASKIGVDLETLVAVLASGGGNSRMLEMMIPWVLRGDDSHLRGPLRIAAKDIRYFTRLAEAAPMAAFIAQAVNQTYALALANGHGERYLPALPGVLAKLNGGSLRDDL